MRRVLLAGRYVKNGKVRVKDGGKVHLFLLIVNLISGRAV
jgi:hypothetical protein